MAFAAQICLGGCGPGIAGIRRLYYQLCGVHFRSEASGGFRRAEYVKEVIASVDG